MKAVVQDRYCLPESLSLDDIDTPTPGEGEVLVRVHAAGVNIADWFIMTGKPYAVRLAYGLRRPRERVRGQDVAGTVEAVGPGVTRFAVGDEVFGAGTGTFAEYAVARASTLVHKPAGVTFEQAGAAPMAALVALQGLRDRGRVESGQKVLVNGASGGIGTFAVQLAVHLGAEVTGVCGPGNVELVRGLGAEVIDYSREDFTAGGEYDVVFDIAANRSLRECRRVLSPRGRLVLAGSKGGALTGGMDRVVGAAIQSWFSRQWMGTWLSTPNVEDLSAVAGLLGSGVLRAVVDRRCGLGEVGSALGYVASRRARGKVVVVP
ncbi:NAD(P)-dependent alcohol dehydrogenase [Actinokineospora sp. NBRC 105648]|uniref:NAD(P)-dependent alcohol dehydrogenase n=1 Tax=Actinokineospora sp. NBRC 105648 TaxID=3032206 RepID=UPI0024A1DC55|nr:NAD(P)-dependent alcohol dehydrogenase [Actinokineospora sp. NBRC 105648]GLZ43749.1 NADPH:quinone reductase [Actinokineospora sp. NBRC 105648]